jgi:hypothetical protein
MGRGDRLSYGGAFQIPCLRHSAIDLGDGTLIQYGAGQSIGDSSRPRQLTELLNPQEWWRKVKGASVHIMSHEEFAAIARHNGTTVRIDREAPSNFSKEEIVQRALSRLGERQYCMLTCNCEHFVTWCETGKACSPQAQAVVGCLALVTGACVSIRRHFRVRTPCAHLTRVATEPVAREMRRTTTRRVWGALGAWITQPLLGLHHSQYSQFAHYSTQALRSRSQFQNTAAIRTRRR